MTKYDRLTSLDASFLHMERLEYPMHVGAMSVIEGAPFFDEHGHFRINDVRELVQSRLPLLPRFRRRLMTVPYDMGRPIWIDDDRFDITYHVRHTALPKPGSWEQLVALTTRVQENLLDRERPLWELWFVEGLEDGNVALIQKTHHSLVDGVSGVDVATLLLDATPEFVAPVPHDWTPEPAPSASQLLLDSLRERATEPGELVRSFRSMLRGPASRGRAGRRAGPFVEHDGDAGVDRAAHVDQRAHRSAPVVVGRADPARRRQGHPAVARRHRQRRDARRCRRRSCINCWPPAATTWKTCGYACCARCRCVPTISTASWETRSRRSSCRCRSGPPTRSIGSRDHGADRRPQGEAAGTQRRPAAEHERLPRADVDEPRGRVRCTASRS